MSALRAPGSVQWLAASVGALGAVGAGALAGGAWWIVAGVAAIASIGAVVDRQLGFAQVLASLVLVAGLVAAGQAWYVAVLAAGTLGSSELLAAADRVTVVRRDVPDLGRVARAIPGAAVLTAAVLVVGAAVGDVPAVGAAAAAVAATMGLRVLAR